jgi:tRNA (guanine-N7-)-methyltransferase
MQKRPIKSFVLRAGRISNRQQHALDNFLTNYSIPQTNLLWPMDNLFTRPADIIVEIGFGMGASLFTMAQQFPEKNFIGIEVHQPGIGSLLADVHEAQLSNVKIATFDAVEVFQHHLPEASIQGIQIFFPDPWPKKRHHKRRLIQAEFLQLILPKLKMGGFIHCATDWQEYAEQMLKILGAEKQLSNSQVDQGFCKRPSSRPLTKFERRGEKLGHGVWDLVFNRVK